MIFAHTYQAILDGRKTQTRRIVKDTEGGLGVNYFDDTGDYLRIKRVVIKGEPPQRVKWEVGKTYAIQPGRGKKAVGRIRITGIRLERLQDMTNQDCLAEGIRPFYMAKACLSDNPPDPRWKFIELWNEVHGAGAWDKNPLVWCLEFERVDDGRNNGD